MRRPRPDKYTLVGKIAVPCLDLLTWATWLDDADRVVKQEDVGALWVSTVFMGLDHNFGDTGPPILFETMIFDGHGHDSENVWCRRSCDWDEAEKTHAEAVRWAEEQVAQTASTLQVQTES